MSKEFQEVITEWEGSLRATGGALVPSKSIDKWLYKKNNETSAEIKVRHETKSEMVTLKRLEAHQSIETLGVHITADGNKKDEFRKFISIIVIW